MGSKNLKLLAIILILLLGALGAKLYLPRIIQPPSPYLEKISKFKFDTITNLQIERGKDKLEFKKESGVWMLNGKKADSYKLSSLFATLSPSNPPQLVAQTDKLHDQFNLTEDKATKVKIGDLIIYLGKSSGLQLYVRLDQSPNVYLLDNTTFISTNPNDWYDKSITKVEKDKITKISFQQPSSSITLIKRDNKWFLENEPKEAKEDKVNSVLLTLASLTAQALVEEKDLGKYPPSPQLTFSFEYDGEKEELEFYKGPENYLVKRKSDGEKFSISETSISSILSAPKELF